MPFQIETEQETDGRWIAEIPQISGVMVYANSGEDGVLRVPSLALRVLAERSISHGGRSGIGGGFCEQFGQTRGDELC